MDHPDALIRLPTPIRFLFQDFRSAPFWLLVRLGVGGTWFLHGLPKLSDPKWVGPEAGRGILDFIGRATARNSDGYPEVLPIVLRFLTDFLEPLADLLAPVFAGLEVALGLLLILGIFTGSTSFIIASFSFLFMLAGESWLNPIAFVVCISLMVAWRVAGWWGLDRWILPRWLSARWNVWNLD